MSAVPETSVCGASPKQSEFERLRPGMSRKRKLLFAAALIVLLLGTAEGVCRLIQRIRISDMVGNLAAWRQWHRRCADGFWLWEGPGANSDGLRDREHSEINLYRYWRIACLGDSVTWGHALPPSQSYPAFLERELRRKHERVEVFNVSMPGWTIRHELMAYERIVRKYKVNDVIVGICLNDIPGMNESMSVSSAAALLASVGRHSALVRVLFNAIAREVGDIQELFVENHCARVEKTWELTLDEIIKLRDAVAADGAQLSLAVFPFRFQLLPDAPEPLPQQRFRDFCAAHDIPYLDALPALQKAGTSVFKDCDHFTPLGAMVVAKTIAESGLIQPPPDHRGR
jgi:hypothetical protein